jgi:hypothetical protein
MTVHPTLQISAKRPWPVCLITSGAIQYPVPSNTLVSQKFAVFVIVVVLPLSDWNFSFSIIPQITFALPKSASLHTPLLSTRTLAPFMSFIPCQ